MAERKHSQRNKKVRSVEALRPKVLIVIVVLLSLFGVWTMLGYSGAFEPAVTEKPRKNGTVSTASLNSNSPSKEYIYAGAKLIATEEGSGEKPLSDFDGDGKADIIFYRNGLWGILLSTQNYTVAQWLSWGGAGLQPLIADFDGDGKVDIGYIVPPSGGQSAAYSILLSSRGYSFSSGQPLFVPAGWPSLGDTPIVSDFDGDGKADPAIWRSSDGTWIIPTSSSNYSSYLFFNWGQSGDVPIAADFDGDGKADIGFYRNGLWGFLLSSHGYSTSNAQFFSWGGAGLQPVIADFDGDGKADIGYIVPPSGGQNAVYAILLSSKSYGYASGQPLFVPAGYPSLGDTPVIADYDGDGQADPGTFRSSMGVWSIPQSTSNYGSYLFFNWGQSGDIPMPNKTNQY